MATVTLPYAYTNGAVTSEEHNDNIFGATGNDGVLRGINGGINSTNLDPGFSLSVDLIQPAGAIYIDHTPMQTAQVDYISEFMGSDDADLRYVVIAGAGVRFYLPNAVRFLKLEVNAQIGQYLISNQTVVVGDGNDTTNDTDGILRLYVDGSAQTMHDTRLHNWTTEIEIVGAIIAYSGRATRHYSFQHMAEDVAAGWHEVMLRLAIANADFGIGTVSGGFGNTNGADTSYEVYGRVTSYGRNAGIVGYK